MMKLTTQQDPHLITFSQLWARARCDTAASANTLYTVPAASTTTTTTPGNHSAPQHRNALEGGRGLRALN